MAVHIKLIRNNIKSSSSYGKYFAKTVSQGEVTLRRHITRIVCGFLPVGHRVTGRHSLQLLRRRHRRLAARI